MSGAEAKERQVQGLARIVSWAQAGVDPSVMGTGPIPAVRSAVSGSLLCWHGFDSLCVCVCVRVCLGEKGWE